MSSEPGDAHQTAGIRRMRWDDAHAGMTSEAVSWWETNAASLGHIRALQLGPSTPVIDAGGGASTLVDGLIADEFHDVTVLDISAAPLRGARRRLGDPPGVRWVAADILTWRPERRYGLWHDRAMFHFLTDDTDVAAYLQTLRAALKPMGVAVITTFALSGPDTCSGLPVRRYAPRDLLRILGPGFHELDSGTLRHRTPQGRTQDMSWVAARFQGGTPTPSALLP